VFVEYFYIKYYVRKDFELKLVYNYKGTVTKNGGLDNDDMIKKIISLRSVSLTNFT